MRRPTSVILVAIVAVNAGAATLQVWQAPSRIIPSPEAGYLKKTNSHLLATVVRSRHQIPPSWYGHRNNFIDISGPVVAYQPKRTLTIPVDSVHGSKFVGSLAVPSGRAPFATNIAASPHFVRMSGIRPVGRTADGYVIAVRADDAPAVGPIVVTIAPAHSAVLRAGVLASVLSVVSLLGLAVYPTSLARRRRKKEGSPP